MAPQSRLPDRTRENSLTFKVMGSIVVAGIFLVSLLTVKISLHPKVVGKGKQGPNSRSSTEKVRNKTRDMAVVNASAMVTRHVKNLPSRFSSVIGQTSTEKVRNKTRDMTVVNASAMVTRHVKNLPSRFSFVIRQTNTTAPSMALVFKTRVVDKCRLQRISALSRITQTMDIDVWVLYDADGKMVRQLHDLTKTNRRVFIAKTPSLDLKRYPPFYESERRDLTWPFINWLKQSKYLFAWYVEDDFVFTGDWHDYFFPAEREAGDADLVSENHVQGSTWPLTWSCRIKGQKCLKNNRIVQTKLALHRMSRRMATMMLHLRAQRQLKGRDEALLAAVCDQWAGCTRSKLYSPGGVYTTGHWGPFVGDTSAAVYTLRGLASYKHKSKQRFNFSEFLTNANVPKGRLYHPVACEAEHR